MQNITKADMSPKLSETFGLLKLKKIRNVLGNWKSKLPKTLQQMNTAKSLIQ